MDNPISNLQNIMRMRNIFGPDNPPPQTIPDLGGNSPSLPDNNILGQSPDFQPPTMIQPDSMVQGSGIPSGNDDTAFQHYLQLLGEAPVREKPSMLRRIGGMVAGLSGDPNLVRGVIDAPYNRKVADWKMKVDPWEKAASLEGARNRSDELDQYRDATLRLNTTKAEDATKVAEGKITVANKNADTARLRAEVSQAALSGGAVIRDNKNGKTYLVNRMGEVKELPIETLAREDEINLQTQGRLAVVNDDQEFRTYLEGIRQGNSLEQIRLRNQGDIDSLKKKKELGLGSSDSGDSPTQQKTAQYIKAQEVYNTHPEWQNYIHLGEPGSNTFSIGGNEPWFESNKKIYNQKLQAINEAIYGKSVSTGPTDNGKPAGSVVKPDMPKPLTDAEKQGDAARKPNTIPLEGKIRVKGPDGREGFIPMKQLESALKQGYTKVVGK